MSAFRYRVRNRRSDRIAPDARADIEKVVIGVFGSYERRKGQDLAVSGMLRLSRELQMQAELRFFGRTLEPRRFRADIEQSASGNRSIVFFGEVDHDECLRQMAACDIILIPSRDDAMSFVGLDALSLGKALVCSRTTGVSEYLQDGQSALILHENTPEEIGQSWPAQSSIPNCGRHWGKARGQFTSVPSLSRDSPKISKPRLASSEPHAIVTRDFFGAAISTPGIGASSSSTSTGPTAVGVLTHPQTSSFARCERETHNPPSAKSRELHAFEPAPMLGPCISAQISLGRYNCQSQLFNTFDSNPSNIHV